jgi:hypothetical protein
MRIVVTYDVVTPESAEQGDIADAGFENEEGIDMTPECDEETAIDNAVNYLRQYGPVEPSSSQFHPEVWYTQTDADIDYRTGAETRKSFHLKDFNEEDQREIYRRIRR